MPHASSMNHIFRSVWNVSLGAMVAVAEVGTAGGAGGTGKARVRGKKGLKSPSMLDSSLSISQLSLNVAGAFTIGSALLSSLLMAPGAAQAQSNPASLPTGAVAIHGTATLNTSQANKLVVTTTNGAGTNHSAVNWQSFSIGAGNTTQIVQPNAASLSINRVVTNTPSALFGTLSSNGNVVLVNQAGITIGAGAYVDTAGFTASAVGMSEVNAKAGRLKFDSNVFNGGGDFSTIGALNVQGTLIARGGDVVLIAPSIELAKTAVVEAQGGAVMLGAGQSVEITGRGLEGITMQVQAPTDSAINLGTLKGDAVGIFAGTLKHSGLIQANVITGEGGKVILKAKELLEVDGQINAQGQAGQGGTVHATADKVWLKGTAAIDASGASGGGEVLIGGGWQGHDERVSNSQRTSVSAGAQIKADATQNGNGGTVVVWSDGLTRFSGQITAKGGSQGGNGGKVEVSGKQRLDFLGQVDVTAAKGNHGSLLLDPNNIVIGTVADLNGDTVTGDDVTGDYNASGASQITAAAVSSLLNSGNLTLTAGNDITVSTAITKTSGSANTFTLTAGNNITLAANISSLSAPLNMSFTAGNDITQSTGSLSAQGGTIDITAIGGNLSLGSISSSSATGGNITLTAGNSITVGGAIASTGTTNGAVKMVAGSGGISNSSSVVTANALEIISGGAVSFAAAQQVATLAATAAGPFAFENGNFGGLTIDTVGATSGIQVTGGDITVRQNGNGSILVNQTVSALSAGNDVLLGIASGPGGITTGVSGVVSGRNVQMDTAGAGSSPITLNANINATGIVTLTSAGGISQLGGGIIANELDAPAAGIGSQNLTGANSISIVRLSRNPTFHNTISSYVLSGSGASSSLVVTGTGSVTIDQPLTYGLGVSIGSDAGITINADINSSGASVNLTTVNGLITQTAGKITSQNVTAAAGTNDVLLTSTTNAVSNVTLSGRHLNFEDTGFVQVGGLTATGNIFLRSTGTINFPGGNITAPGQISLVSGGALTLTGDVTATGAVAITASGGAATLQNVTTNGGALSVVAESISGVNLSTLAAATGGAGGAIGLTATAGAVNTTGNLDTRAVLGSGGTLGGSSGNVAVNATGSITIGGVNADGFNGPSSTFAAAKAGDVTLQSSAGAISVGPILSRGDPTSGIRRTGGAINMTAPGNISANNIYTQGAVGGSVTLTSGGNVTLTGPGGIFTDQNISTSGGSINITANDITIGAIVYAGEGNVTISATAARTISLGANLLEMDISGAELQNITAGNLFLNSGTAATTGNRAIYVDGITAANSANIDKVTLTAQSAGTANTNPFVYFSGSPSTFKALDVRANAGIYITTDITTTVGAMSFNSDMNGVVENFDKIVTDGNRTLVSAGLMSFAKGLSFGSSSLGIATGNVSLQGLGISTADLYADQGTGTVAVNAGTGTLTLGGLANAGVNNLSFSGANITLGGPINATGKNVTLLATGAVSQCACSYIDASGLELKGAGSFILNSSAGNTVSTLAVASGGASDGPVEVTSTSTLLNVGTVNSTVGITRSGNVTLNASSLSGGTINQNNDGSGAMNVGGVTTLASTGSIQLLSTANQLVGQININTTGIVNLVNNRATLLGNVGDVATPFVLAVDTHLANGAISQAPGTSITSGTLSLYSGTGAITLGSTGNNFSALGVVQAGAVTVADTAATLNLNNLTAESVSIVSSGSIESLGGTLTSTGGPVSIVSTGGAVDIALDGVLDIVSAGGITLKSAGNLRVAGATLTAGSGGNVVLTSTGGLLDAGVTSVATVNLSGGRWLTYLPSSVGHTYGPFDPLVNAAFRQVNAPEGTTPLGTGNGSLFANTANPAAVSATLTGTVTKAYDALLGIPTTGATLGSLTGTLFGEVSATLAGGTGTLTTADVGTGKAVTITGATLSNVAAGNGTLTYGYQFSSASGPIGIVTPAVVQASAVSLNGSRVYDGTAVVNADIFALSGLVQGQTLSLAGAGTVADKNVGVDKPVSLGTLTLGNGTGSGSGLASNYTLTGGTHLATITAAPITGVTGITAINKIYDATTKATLDTTKVSLTGVVPNDKVSLSSVTGTFSDKNVGDTKAVAIGGITLSGADLGNYTFTPPNLTTAANISRATLSAVTGITASNKTYDATTAATVNITKAALTGLVDGDKLSVASATGAFSDKNAGIGKTVTVSGITLTGADVGNYTLASDKSSTTAEISRAVITNVANLLVKPKVYDGKTTATLDTSTATLVGLLGADQLNVSDAQGTYADRNVGNTKSVNITNLALGGADAANYTLASNIATAKGDITVRPLATWTASAGGQWSTAGNWDALPDGANVLAVNIPAGSGSIDFDASVANTTLQTLTIARPLVVRGSTLSLLSGLSLSNLSQTAGSLSSTGGLNVTNSLNSSGGSMSFGGAAVINQTTGDLLVGALSAPSINLTALSGAINQSGPVSTGSLQTASATGTNLTNGANAVASFRGTNTTSGSIVLNNNVVLDITGVSNTGGDLILNNIGGVRTTGFVISPNGRVLITANSPLTIGPDGVTAGGDIVLAATNLTSAGNVTLNGPIASQGFVTLNAAGNLTQNSTILGAKGIVANAAGTLTYGPAAGSGNATVVYNSGGVVVTPPSALPQTTATTPTTPAGPGSSPASPPVLKADIKAATDVLVTLVAQLAQAQSQKQTEPESTAAGTTTNADGTTKRKVKEAAVVAEGEICRP